MNRRVLPDRGAAQATRRSLFGRRQFLLGAGMLAAGAAAAAAPGMLLAARPAAAAIPPLRKVLLEIACPNFDLLSVSFVLSQHSF